MSTVTGLPGGKRTNNNYSSSGSDDQLTTSRACNNASDGTGQSETSNQATWSYSGRTTGLHFISLQL